MDPRRAFGHAVRERRERRGISQERLGEAAGLDRTYISSIERGRRNVSLINICRLAGALDCRPAELVADLEPLPLAE
jgi:transcriptional regulator with XRE-family HTH domain